MQLTIKVKDLHQFNSLTDAPYTSSGQLYDLLAVAAGHQEYNDLETFDVASGSIDYVLKEYDYEQSFIVALNDTKDDYAAILRLAGERVSSPAIDRAGEAGLLFGAWYALNMPEQFAESLDEYKDACKDAATDCLGDYIGRENLPIDLAQDLEKAYTDAMDDDFNIYLHGDHRDYRGVYREAERALFADHDISLDQNDDDRRNNVLQVTIADDDAQLLAADHEGIGELTRPIGKERIKTAIIETIVSAARINDDERKARSLKHKEEYAKTKAYQAERAQKEANERKQRLLKMTK